MGLTGASVDLGPRCAGLSGGMALGVEQSLCRKLLLVGSLWGAGWPEGRHNISYQTFFHFRMQSPKLISQAGLIDNPT